MMSHERDQQASPEPFGDMQRGLNLALKLAMIWSRPIEAWTRKPGTFGERYHGIYPLLGLMFVPVFSAFLFPHDSPEPGIWFLLATALAFLIHRIVAVRNRLRGDRCHSRYTGTSWIPGDEVRVKTWWEPLSIIGTGVLILGFSLPLGTYLIGAGVSMHIICSHLRAEEDARLRDLRDAALEQQLLAERYRNEF